MLAKALPTSGPILFQLISRSSSVLFFSRAAAIALPPSSLTSFPMRLQNKESSDSRKRGGGGKREKSVGTFPKCIHLGSSNAVQEIRGKKWSFLCYTLPQAFERLIHFEHVSQSFATISTDVVIAETAKKESEEIGGKTS